MSPVNIETLSISHENGQVENELKSLLFEFECFSGVNRIQSTDHLVSTFGIDCARVMRFSVEQIEEIILVLEVSLY